MASSATFRLVPADAAGARARALRRGRHGWAAPPPGGFTLIESICALSVVGMVLGLVIINVSGWHETRKLQEGALKFEVILRLARADAANLGKRFRVAADQDTHQVQVFWEYDPLAKPGEFTRYTGGAWARSVPNDLVWVQKMELTGASALRTLALDEIQDPREREALEGLAPITFYSDGSSDSARVELVTRTGEPYQEIVEDPDARLAVIDLDGINGLIRTRILTLEELEEQEEAARNPAPRPAGYAEDCEECDR